MQTTPSPRLTLASGSPYRAELLGRILQDFDTCAANIDESALEGESAHALADRLAKQKAEKVAASHPDQWVLGCDQVAILRSGQTTEILGKPHTAENAFRQLRACSGQTVEFYSACCLLNKSLDRYQPFADSVWLEFRSLTDEQIRHYLQREQPFDCAGSIKSEALGIALIQRQRGDDPNTLIGLPLIKLIDQLALIGIDVLA